jgi:hypothetical protein
VNLDYLKRILNPSTSNLEILSLDFEYSSSLDKFVAFVSPGFPRLRTLNLSLTRTLTLGELVPFSRLHRALSKPGIDSELVLQVSRLTLLDKSQLKEYQALGI